MLPNKIKNSWTFKKYHRKVKNFLAANVYNNAKYLPVGIDRVYHIHIRKSAGTSINSAFWGLDGYNLNSVGREPIILGKNYSYVRYSKELIEKGDYFYANSHFEFWNLNLKSNTFTFTMLREPYERLVSLYKYYNWVDQVDDIKGEELDSSYVVLKEQLHLLGNSFTDFINNLSNKYLFNQLYVFSEKLEVDDALKNLEKLDRVYFKDNFKESVENLKTSLNLEHLSFKNERRFENVNFTITEKEKLHAISVLSKEIEFYNIAKNRHFNLNNDF